MDEVLGRRLAQWERQQDLSPHDPEHDESFAALPNVIVIDGGPGQLAAGLRGAAGLPRARRHGDLAGQAPRGGLRARACARRCVLGHDTPELQLLQRVRDEAHRFAITHHRGRRDKAMTVVGARRAARRRPGAQARDPQHFGSPEAFLAASREELEAVPGLPGKIARELWTSLHKTGV